MTGRARRRGVFEGMPRALYRRTGARYLDACAAEIVGNGVVVAIFSVAVIALYVDLGAGELGTLAACLLVGYVAESLLAGHHLRRVGAPIRAGAAQPAWEAAARLPLGLVPRPSLHAVGVAVAAGRGPEPLRGRGGGRRGGERRARRAARAARVPGGARVPGALAAVRVLGGAALHRPRARDA